MDNGQEDRTELGLGAGGRNGSVLGSNGGAIDIGSRPEPSNGYDDNHASEETPLLPVTSQNGADPDEIYTWEGAADFEGLPWWKQPSIFWLLPPFFLYAMAFGGIAVPRITLALKLICREYLSEKSRLDPTFTFLPVTLSGENPQCRIPEVQSLATKFMLYVSLIAGILSALVTPKLGALSDRFGRKPLLCFVTVGGMLSEVVTILAARYPDSIHYTWLLGGAVFEGVCGSYIAGMAITHSYASDCTAPADRAVAFGYFHACLFGGVALGPLVAGYIIKWTGDVTITFIIALICHFIYFAAILFVVPESLTKKRQLAAREKHRLELEATDGGSETASVLRALNPRQLLAPLKVLWPTGEGSSAALRWNLILLATVDTLLFGISTGAITVVLYYTELVFHWGDFETSILISITSISRVLGLVLLLPLLNYLFRTLPHRLRRNPSPSQIESQSQSQSQPHSQLPSLPSTFASQNATPALDMHIIRLGLVFELLGFTGYALAPTGGFFIASGVLASAGGIAAPTLASALTRHVPQDQTGALLGATGLLHALARIVFPVIFGVIYAGTVGRMPGLVFGVLAGMFAVGLGCAVFLRGGVYVEEQPVKPRSRMEIEAEERQEERILDEETTPLL